MTGEARRRVPRQRRSREIVEAIVEAGRRLLRGEGPEALTTNRIAEAAGVSIGSLYRYFPNKEAVIAAIYEGLAEREVAEVRAAGEWAINDLAIVDALAAIVDFQLARHRDYLALGGDYYREHHRGSSLARRVGAGELARRLREFLDRHGAAVRVRDVDHAVFVLGRGISAIVRCAVEEQPEKLSDPAFRDELVDLAVAYVTSERAVAKRQAGSRNSRNP